MAKEFILYSHLDPVVWEAQSTALKLYDDFLSCEDPLTKKVFEKITKDALKNEVEIELKSRVSEAVKMLHNLEKPAINPN